MADMEKKFDFKFYKIFFSIIILEHKFDESQNFNNSV